MSTSYIISLFWFWKRIVNLSVIFDSVVQKERRGYYYLRIKVETPFPPVGTYYWRKKLNPSEINCITIGCGQRNSRELKLYAAKRELSPWREHETRENRQLITEFMKARGVLDFGPRNVSGKPLVKLAIKNTIFSFETSMD